MMICSTVTDLIYDQAVDGQLGQLCDGPGLREEAELLQLLHDGPALVLQGGAGVIVQQRRRQRHRSVRQNLTQLTELPKVRTCCRNTHYSTARQPVCSRGALTQYRHFITITLFKYIRFHFNVYLLFIFKRFLFSF